MSCAAGSHQSETTTGSVSSEPAMHLQNSCADGFRTLHRDFQCGTTAVNFEYLFDSFILFYFLYCKQLSNWNITGKYQKTLCIVGFPML